MSRQLISQMIPRYFTYKVIHALDDLFTKKDRDKRFEFWTRTYAYVFNASLNETSKWKTDKKPLFMKTHNLGFENIIISLRNIVLNFYNYLLFIC